MLGGGNSGVRFAPGRFPIAPGLCGPGGACARPAAVATATAATRAKALLVMWGLYLRVSQPADKPSSVPRLRTLRRVGETTIIPLGPRLLAGSSDLPGGFGRAVLWRHPIWPCSVRGFACHRRYRRRGALLPHLFTLTLRLGAYAPPSGRYFFCATGPSSCPARELPGALPYGARTFLSSRHFAANHGFRKQRSSSRLRRTIITLRNRRIYELTNSTINSSIRKFVNHQSLV